MYLNWSLINVFANAILIAFCSLNNHVAYHKAGPHPPLLRSPPPYSMYWWCVFFDEEIPCSESCTDRRQQDAYLWVSVSREGGRRNKRNQSQLIFWLALCHWCRLHGGMWRGRAKLPHHFDDIAIIWCNIERKGDVYTPTREFRGDRPMDGLFFERVDTENVAQIPFVDYGKKVG